MCSLETQPSLTAMKTIAVALLLALLTFVAGCGGDDDGGGDLPDGVVAEVNGDELTQAQFDGMLAAITVNRGGEEGAACVKAWRKQDSVSAACQRLFDQFEPSAMRALVRGRWYQNEAKARDVNVDDAAIDVGEFAKQVEAQGMKVEEMQAFLRYVSLNQQLTAPLVQKATSVVTEQELRDHYERIKERFHEPEQRYVRSVVAGSEADARDAKAALEDGETWERVATKFADDQIETQWNGLLVNVYRVGDEALERAAYAAEKNEIGVVKAGNGGWYVFQLKVIQPEQQEPLKNMREYVKGQVQIEKQEQVVKDFNLDLRRKYGGETRCASAYEIPDCRA
jgi:hypothetical protein